MFKERFVKYFHPGPTLERDINNILDQLKTDDLGYKEVFEKALEKVQVLNTVYDV